MKKLILIVLSIGLINSSFAQNAVSLNKGAVTPFKGVLITEEKAIELDKAKRSNIVLKDLRISQKELTEYHRQDARVQRRKLSEAKFKSYMGNIGMFVLGVILTGFTFKLNQKIGDI